MRRIGFIGLILFGLQSLCAQWDVVEEVFIPPTYYVGDPVLLQFRLVWENEKVLNPPEVLPGSEWLEIESVTVEQTGYEALVNVRFRSFITGTRSLPPLELGDITVDTLKIFTSSLVEEHDIREIQGIRENLNFPGMKILIPFFLLFLISLPYLLYLFIHLVVDKLKVLFRILFSSGPRRKVSRLVKKLETRLDDKERERAFYIDLSSGIRTYLTERTGRDFHSMTTRDIRYLNPPPVEAALWRELVELLKMADLVKFAGERISRKDKVHSLSVMHRFIESLEKEDHDADH
ncbi:MAG: hypothetical protein PQJ59_07250 [Spirochaetales bacterium]|nr:hypothetical protein [Spirochaetales bacterium]